MAKPIVDYTWATDVIWSSIGQAWDGLNTKSDPAAVRAQGFTPTPLAANHLNWLFAAHAEWLAWLEDRVENVNATETFTVHTGGEFSLESGALANSLGTLQVGSGGLLDVLGGGGLALRAGSVMTSDGEAYFSGTTEFLSGGAVTFRSGGIVDLLCGMNVGDAVTPKSGMIQFNGATGHAGGYAYFLGPDCFSFADTATGTLDGVLVKRSAGRVTNRIIAGADPGGGTQDYGPEDADTIVAESLSNPRTYDLTGAALHGDRITIINRSTSHSLAVYASTSAIFVPFGTVPISLKNAAGERYAVTLEYSDGAGSNPAIGWYLVSEIRVP